MTTWHEALADRTIVVGSSVPDEMLRRWIDHETPAGAPPAPLGRFALLARGATPGIVSEFYRHGQIVKVGIVPDQIVSSPALRAEWQTILERTIFRHRLERIVCSYPLLAEFAFEVAERLDVRFVSATL